MIIFVMRTPSDHGKLNNNQMKSGFSILLLIFYLSSYSQQTVIYGNAPEYAGEQISFYYFNDLINRNEKELCKFDVGKDGDFSCSFDLQNITYSFVRLGVFNATVFFEPDHSYKIVFPPKKDKTEKEKLDRYFAWIEIDLGIMSEDKNELNYAIQDFDQPLNDFIDRNIYKIRVGVLKNETDSLRNRLDKQFSGINNKYFIDYKKYRFAYLYYLGNMRSANPIIKEYYYQQKILFNNKAYMDSFNFLFDSFLTKFSNQEKQKCLSSSILLNHGLDKVYSCLAKDVYLSDPGFRELVLIKGIHDSYLNNSFPQKSLESLINSIINKPILENNYRFALNLKKSLNQSDSHNMAPDFLLKDVSNKIYNLKSYKEKFIYLNILNSLDNNNKDELRLLNKMYMNNSDKLTFITISTNKIFQELKLHFSVSGYLWNLMTPVNSNNFLNDYNVKSYPLYFLIGPNGEYILSPAPPPSESFEIQFGNIFQEQKIRDLRTRIKH